MAKAQKWKVADLAATYQISTTTARDILKRADIAPENATELEAAGAFIDYYRTQAEGPEMEAAGNRARKAKAEADAAEIDVAQKSGRLVLKDHVELVWKDAIAQWVEMISKEKTLTQKQKALVLGFVRRVKIDETQLK